MESIARLSLVALDCREPAELAGFYSRITGWDVRPWEDDEWIQLVADGPVTIAFQKAPGHEPPQWPSDSHPQQLHLDFDVDDLDAGEEGVLAIGARKAEFQPYPDDFRVYLDPAGHPFCLVLAG